MDIVALLASVSWQHWLVLGDSKGLDGQLIAGREWAYRLEEQQYRTLAKRVKDLLAPGG